MELRTLSKKEIQAVYRDHLRHDFPEDERKPLAMILRALDRGQYLCLGWMDGEQLIGYAFFVTNGVHYLLDYLATVSTRRGLGHGSAMLRELASYLSGVSSVLVEIEDPAFAETPDEALLRNRRMQFYLRNGLRSCEVTFSTFGVEYLLLEMTQFGMHSRAEIMQLYQEHYRSILPEAIFRKMIIPHE